MRHQIRSIGSTVLFVVALLGSATIALGQSMNVDGMAVYSQGIAVVQETRNVALEPGFNEVGLAIPEGLILESLLIRSDANILWSSFHPSQRANLLADAVGQTVEVVDQTGAMYRGELLAHPDGVLLRQASGAVILVADPVTVRLPDGAAFAAAEDAELVVAMSSPTGGEASVDLLYIVSGISWDASYTIIVSEEDTTGTLRTGISVTNGAGGAFSTPALSLIAGDIYVEEAGFFDDYARVSAMSFEANAPASVTAEGVGEYYRYLLPYPVALEDEETLALSYARSEAVSLVEEFIFDATVSNDVRIRYTFDNDSANRLDIPLPSGKVRVYQIDEIGPVLLGEDTIPHTAAGDTVELHVGAAFDLEADRTLLERTWIAENRYQETVEIVLRSAETEPVSVSVFEHPSGTTWTILGATLPYERVDAGTIQFDVQIPAGGEAVVGYTVEYAY